MSNCRTCGAAMLWALTKNGKRIPLDAEPNPAGNVELSRVGEGVPFATVHKGPPGMFDDWEAWMPHHATCPNWAR